MIFFPFVQVDINQKFYLLWPYQEGYFDSPPEVTSMNPLVKSYDPTREVVPPGEVVRERGLQILSFEF